MGWEGISKSRGLARLFQDEVVVGLGNVVDAQAESEMMIRRLCDAAHVGILSHSISA
jgi:hypothetical protein